MIKEQRKAIENLSEINNLSKEELQNENITAILDYEDLKSLDTVLSLIKEHQEEIDELKRDNTDTWYLNSKMSRRHLEDICRMKKKDKQIDLMALAILNYDDQLVINRYKNIDEVKETFEKLAKEKGE